MRIYPSAVPGSTDVVHLLDFSEEVKRGAALLDEIAPGWEHSIQPQHLVLSSPTNCVLGQLWMNQVMSDPLSKLNTVKTDLDGVLSEGYFTISDKIAMLASAGQISIKHFDDEETAAEYGFNIEDHLIYDAAEALKLDEDEVETIVGSGWDALTDEWKLLIRDRTSQPAVLV